MKSEEYAIDSTDYLHKRNMFIIKWHCGEEKFTERIQNDKDFHKNMNDFRNRYKQKVEKYIACKEQEIS